MTRKHTRAERRGRLKEKYFIKKERVFVLVFMAAVFMVLLAIASYGISVQADPFLLFVLVVLIIVLIPVTVFVVDLLNWER